MSSLTLPRHSRYDYSPIIERKDYSWPGGKRLAILHHYQHRVLRVRQRPRPRQREARRAADAAQLLMARLRQSRRHLAILRYVRRLEAAGGAQHQQPPLRLCAADIRSDPAPQRRDRRVMAARTPRICMTLCGKPDEARVIKEITETFASHEGAPPQGWMGAGTYENATTPDLLKEAGYKYLMDWPCDDQPIWMRTRSGPLLCVPYPAEINDSPAIVHRQHSAREFCEMIVDQFDEMIEQCVDAASRIQHLDPSLHLRPAVPPASAAQGAQTLRRAQAERPRLVVQALRHFGLLLFIAARNHSGQLAMALFARIVSRA